MALMRSRKSTQGRNTHVVIFEPNYTGHRLEYCRWILEACDRHGLDATLAMSTNGLASTEFKNHVGEVRIDVLDLGALPTGPVRDYLDWTLETLQTTRSQFPAASILVLEGDKLLPGLLRRRIGRDRKLAVLVMRMPRGLGAALRGGLAPIVKYTAAHLLRRRGVHILSLCPAPERADRYTYGDLPSVPDAVAITPEADRSQVAVKLALDPNRHWFGTFGHITARKNLDLIAEALRATGSVGRIGLLIGGWVPEEEWERSRNSLEAFIAAGGQVVALRRFLSTEDLDGAIQAVDTALLIHSADGPSGILGKSAAIGTRVICAGAPVLRAYVADHPDIGIWVPLGLQHLTQAFASDLQESRKTKPLDLANPNDFAQAFLKEIDAID